MSAPGCVICGAPDPLRLGLCPACGPAPGRDDAVVFVDAAAREPVRDALYGVFGDAVGSAAGRVAAGRVPLLRLPRGLADRAATRLGGAGVPARAVPAVAAWTRMPWHFFAMVGLVVLTGSLAGATAAPAMMWTTPLFAALLGVAAQEGMRRPALAARARGGLGSPARTVASATLGDLPDGEPRSLLAEIVQLANRLLEIERRPADVDELVISAAATAREVDLLAGARAALSGSADADGVAGTCARMHASGLALLRRAVGALGSLSAAGGPGADHARERLTDIVQEMESESAAHFAAALEVSRQLDRP